MRSFGIFLPFGLSVVACGGSVVPSGAPADDLLGSNDGAVAAEPLEDASDGVYEVPVSDPALASAATYGVSVKFQQLRDGTYRLHYDLPSSLVGSDTEVDFRGDASGDTFTLPGEVSTVGDPTKRSATASCTTTGTEVVCNERFPGLPVDMTGVDSALASQGITGTARTQKLAVSARFGIDPIGILRFSRSGHGSRGGRSRTD